MLTRVARFEVKHQLTSPIFWITSLVFFGLTISLVISDSLRIGWGGYVVRNSPYTIGLICLIMTLFGIFIVTAFVANVILRDDETGFGPIIRSTRLSSFDYLFGRFFGAFAVCALVFLSVPIGAFVGAALPWHDPSTVGPFHLGTYLYVYAVLCLPILFVMAAAFFALATLTRSMITTYMVALIVLMMYFLSARYFARLEYKDLVALLDPFGLSAFRRATERWTPAERNTLLPPFFGPILRNRALWTAVALACLGAVWRSYRAGTASLKAASKSLDSHSSESVGSATKAVPAPNDLTSPSRPSPSPAASPDNRRSLGWAPLVALTKFDVRSVLRSPAYILLLGIASMNAIVGLWIAGDDNVSITLPVTRLLIKTLFEQYTQIPLVIAAYYAGELVWRDRERRVHEIVDATPATDWAFVVPKIIAIAVVLITMALLIVAASLIVQLLKGYPSFELGHYVTWFMVPWVITMLLYAVLAVFIQTMVPNKFGGFLVTLLIIAAQLGLNRLGLEHNLYQFGNTPPVPLSDMNGQGAFAGHAAWFRVYWMAFATVLAVIAYGLWRRGASAPLRRRLTLLPSRLKGATGYVLAGGALSMAAVGGFIVYNTNGLNEYRTSLDSQRWSAEYEKTVLGFSHLPQPKITDVTLTVDLYPSEPRVVTRGRYTIENKTDKPLSEVHVSWARALEQKSFLGTLYTSDLQMQSLEVVGAHVTRDFPDLHYRIYTFDPPLAPGQRTEVRFETLIEQRGFRNSNNETRVVANGTFLDNWRIAPWLGVNGFELLQDRTTRRKFGLPDELRPPPLEQDSARAFNYFRHDADWVNVDLTVSTGADQTIVAPGELVDSATTNGRRVSHFRTASPILDFFSIQSARYAVREDHWKDVKLAVYYHPAHPYNVDRFLRAMKASLDYYSTNFSPYQFRQLKIVEFPDYAAFAQAFPGTIPYSEAAGFIFDNSHADRIDFNTYITAHETGHQWWAHQVIGADMQGQTVLSETLAQYSALMVMERMYGPAEIRRFLKNSLDGYLRNRGSDVLGEVPLERVENQAHIRYRKGGMVMYLLKDLLGEAAVNRALQSLIQTYAFKGPPYPTSRDLVDRLRAQAGPEYQQLITDLFEKITLYDLKVTNATATAQADGKWRVSMDVEAKKLYADAKGAETEAPLDELFDVGVFTAEPGRPGFKADNVLSMQRQRVRTGHQTWTVVVDHEPKYVGLDPYNKYVDRNSDDNLRAVSAAPTVTSARPDSVAHQLQLAVRPARTSPAPIPPLPNTPHTRIVN